MSDIKQVAAALVKAQKAFGPALKTSNNPHFKSRYADLSACVEAVIDALNENGIALIQRNIPCESGVTVETLFVHESGEMLSSGPLHVPASKQDAQGYGSALTYARRYSLMSACGIAPEDDDGNAAANKSKARQSWLDQQRAAIFCAKSTGELKTIHGGAVAVAMAENDSAAVDLLNAWADEKRAQAKPKEQA